MNTCENTWSREIPAAPAPSRRKHHAGWLRNDFSFTQPARGPTGLFSTLRQDYHARCAWYGHACSLRGFLRSLVTDGSLATLLCRAIAWCAQHRVEPAAMILGKILTFTCGMVVGRRARFGPGLVLLHPVGVVINTGVTAGRNCIIESNVTIGAEKGRAPALGDHVFLGSGARVLGSARVGRRARIGANAVVLEDIPDDATAVGIPARVVRRREKGERP